MNWLIVLLILVFLIYLAFQLAVWNSRKKWSPADLKFYRENWNRIMQNQDGRYRLMEADKLLDHMLKIKGLQGSLGDKLKKQADSFSDINGLWQAHKLRNKLAHELDAKINSREIDSAMSSFRRAFGDIGLHFK